MQGGATQGRKKRKGSSAATIPILRNTNAPSMNERPSVRRGESNFAGRTASSSPGVIEHQ